MSQKSTTEQSQSDDVIDQPSTDANIAQALISSMAEPSDHAIAQFQQEQAAADEKTNITDKAGDTFNADIHATDSEGNPKFTSTGNFAKKRGRRASTDSILAAAKAGNSVPDQSAVIKANKQAATGQMAANALIMLGMVLGGEEWRPVQNEKMGIDEKANLEQCFTDYFTAKNMDDISPNMALAIGILGYALPRFTMPKTQERSKSLWGKAKAWWANRQLKKVGLKAEAIKSVKDGEKKES